MSKTTNSNLSSMSIDELNNLGKQVKLAIKAQRLNANKAVASSLSIGDTVEFTVPKTTTILTGHVSKVKRVMIAVKAVGNAGQFNVPLTSIKKIASVKATKGSAAVKAVKAKTDSVKAKKGTSAVTKKAPAPSVKSNAIKAIKDKIAAKKAAAKSSTPIVASDVSTEETASE